MNFLNNPQPLLLESNHRKSQSYQYYQWKYKQIITSEEQQEKALKNMLQDILVKQKQNQMKKDNFQKCYFHPEGSFYDYTKEWKKKIESKNIEEKMILQAEKEEKQRLSMIPQPQKQIEAPSFFVSLHKGPVSGWREHFQCYLKAKSTHLYDDQENTFQPKINEKSKKLTRNMTGKVEDRLLKYGEELKVKKKQESIMNAEHHQYSFSDPKTQSQLYYRLFKDGEKANRKKANCQENINCSFQPSLHSLTKQMEEKVSQKRKPLYHVKNLNNTPKMEQKTVNFSERKQSFESFLKRNQALIDAKKRKQLKHTDEILRKQELQSQKFTYFPTLNKNSVRINSTKDKQNQKYQSEAFTHQCKNSDLKTTERFTTNNNNQETMGHEDSLELKTKTKYESSNQIMMDSLQIDDSLKGNFEEGKNHECDESRISSGTKRKNYSIKSKLFAYDAPVAELEGEDEEHFDSLEFIEPEQKLFHDNVDSLNVVKDESWESEISQIESKISSMMMRAKEVL